MDKKLNYIKVYCQKCGDLDFNKVLKLMSSTSFFKPVLHSVPICDGIKGEGSYLLYQVMVAGHNIQLTWGIHEISAGDCSASSGKHGVLTLNEYAVTALVVRLFPKIKDELEGKEIELTSISDESQNNWRYFVKDKDLIL